MPRPTAEQLKKWYASFERQMRERGTDINTMRGRMSILGVYAGPLTKKGEPSLDNQFYAFAQTDGKGNYTNAYPHFLDNYADLNDESDDVRKDPLVIDGKIKGMMRNFMDNALTPQTLENLENIPKDFTKMRDNIIKYHDDLERNHEPVMNWMKENMAPIHPERDEDLPRIEALYNLAANGMLVHMAGMVNCDAGEQIYVNQNGECSVAPRRDETVMYNSSDPVESFFNNSKLIMDEGGAKRYLQNQEIRAEYEKRFGKTLADPLTTEMINEFREDVLSKFYPDIPKGSRCEMADNYLDTAVIQSRSVMERDQSVEPSDMLMYELQSTKELMLLEEQHPGYIPDEGISPEQTTRAREAARQDKVREAENKLQALEKRFSGETSVIWEAIHQEEEDIRRWYADFETKMAEEGVDLQNPRDLMTFNVFFETGKTSDPLTGRFAFIATDERGKYKSPEPVIEDKAVDDVAKASDPSEARNNLHAKHDEWLIKNLKPIDPNNPADYERMKILYKQAQKGLLSYSSKFTPDSLRQISVNAGKKCNVGIAMEEVPSDLSNITWHELTYNNKIVLKDEDYATIFNNPGIRMAYEQKYDKRIIDKVPVPELPKAPEKVPKPGAWSWIKRIFTFGVADGDFKRYEEYSRRFQEYETEREETKKRIKDAESYNKRVDWQWKNVGRDLALLRHPENPNQASVLNNNFHAMYNNRTAMGVDSVHSDAAKTELNRHMQTMWNVGKDHPEIFSEKNINPQKGYVPPKVLTDIENNQVAGTGNNAEKQYATMIPSALVTQEVSKMKLSFDKTETTRNLQLQSVLVDRILPTQIHVKDIRVFDDLVNFVKNGDIADTKPLGESSAIMEEIAKFGDSSEKGLAIFTGILSQAGKKELADLADYVLMSGKNVDMLKADSPDAMKHLIDAGKSSVCDENGNVNPEKYAAALSNVIAKCCSDFYYKNNEGLDAHRIAISALASRMSEQLDSMGCGNLLSENTRSMLAPMKQVVFLTNVATAGAPVFAVFEGAEYIEDTQKKQKQMSEEIERSGKTIGSQLIHALINDSIKSGDFKPLQLICNTDTMLNSIDRFEQCVKKVDNPMQLAGFHLPDNRARMARNLVGGAVIDKGIKERSIDVTGPKSQKTRGVEK